MMAINNRAFIFIFTPWFYFGLWWKISTIVYTLVYTNAGQTPQIICGSTDMASPCGAARQVKSCITLNRNKSSRCIPLAGSNCHERARPSRFPLVYANGAHADA
jgi:hypothetical protein